MNGSNSLFEFKRTFGRKFFSLPATLTSARLPLKWRAQVFPTFSNSYAGWRRQAPWQLSLHDGTDVPSEDLLQAAWFHQRLLRDRLTTLDGQAVRVLHPGFWNHEAGPDFRGAMIQFGSDAPVQGDVEIDLRNADWKAHGHDSNPAFKNVVLHVVWRQGGSSVQPTMELEPVLDSPLAELRWWHGSDAAQSYPTELVGRCCAPLRELSATQLSELLQQAAAIRLQSKASQFQARARQVGWEQALWEGLFRGLGYKRNLWPMLRLGELRSQVCPEQKPPSILSLQARLLGVAGLLPDELMRRQASSDTYVRRLWDSWWREREAFADWAMPRSLWNFAGLRPANHPQRRLALMAHWLVEGGLAARLEKWCITSIDPAHELETLLATLQIPEDEFWNRHWTFRSKNLAASQPLLGAARVTDLAVNIILPWLWVRAVEGGNEALRREIERRYFVWPAAEDNSVLKLARQRLLGGAMPKGLRTAAAQQGLLQVVRDFCGHSNAICSECRFPGLVKAWHPGK